MLIAIITPSVSIHFSIINKYGITARLREIRTARRLCFLHTIPGASTVHAKIMELTVIRDHVNFFVIARSQITQTAAPRKNRIDITISTAVRISLDLRLTSLSAKSSVTLTTFSIFVLSVARSPLNSSVVVTPSISERDDSRPISGQLIPVSHS